MEVEAKDSNGNQSKPEEPSSNQSFIKEGTAEILQKGNVFYNPVQEFNRDLSISVLNTFINVFKEEQEVAKKKNKKHQGNKKIVILEALSATGLRSIRYAQEVEQVDEIIANDLSREAVEHIDKNLKHNKVDHIVKSSQSCASAFMYKSVSENRRFTAIDLDPYGNPTRFLDGAVQSIAEGGLLLITATDLAILCGNTPEACYVKYGSVPLKTKFCHEMALRILLRCIESSANRYGKYIKPLLSISVDFYVRVFVRVFSSQFACKDSATKQSMVFQCTGCESFVLQPVLTKKPTGPNSFKYGIPTGPFVGSQCDFCGFKYHLAGPIWSNPIHDEDFVKRLVAQVDLEGLSFNTYKRIYGLLRVVQEELHDVPLYYTVENLCSILKLETIPMLKIRSALLHEGFKVSYSHACKTSIKTNAPPEVLWDILRCWEKLNPVKPERKLEGVPLTKILSKESEKSYNLTDIHESANPESRKDCLARFPENPMPYWGPGTRATQNIDSNKTSKKEKNQNKKTKRKELDSSLDSSEENNKNCKLTKVE